MDTIEALRERADLARQQLSDQNGNRLRLFERLSDRINAVADELRDKRETIAAYGERVDRLTIENDQLREILQSLLLAIEADANHGLSPALRTLESTVCGMVEGDGAADDGQTVAAAVIPDNDETGQEPAADVIMMDGDPAIEMENTVDSEGEPAIEDESDDETPISVAPEAAGTIDADQDIDLPIEDDVDQLLEVEVEVDSVIDDAVDDTVAATAPADEESSDTVSSLNAIGDIVQRLMLEMTDPGETAEDEEIVVAELTPS